MPNSLDSLKPGICHLPALLPTQAQERQMWVGTKENVRTGFPNWQEKGVQVPKSPAPLIFCWIKFNEKEKASVGTDTKGTALASVLYAMWRHGKGVRWEKDLKQ